jgi:hypothetical protein
MSPIFSDVCELGVENVAEPMFGAAESAGSIGRPKMKGLLDSL